MEKMIKMNKYFDFTISAEEYSILCKFFRNLALPPKVIVSYLQYVKVMLKSRNFNLYTS